MHTAKQARTSTQSILFTCTRVDSLSLLVSLPPSPSFSLSLSLSLLSSSVVAQTCLSRVFKRALAFLRFSAPLEARPALVRRNSNGGIILGDIWANGGLLRIRYRGRKGDNAVLVRALTRGDLRRVSAMDRDVASSSNEEDLPRSTRDRRCSRFTRDGSKSRVKLADRSARRINTGRRSNRGAEAERGRGKSERSNVQS